ncbi:MAG TPA: hypothetical protein VFZ61_13585 [Polyangiales bacterium]
MNSAELAREQPETPAPTEDQLLDVLYEVLAQGVPPKGNLRTEDVERFLHEHARTKKSVSEILQFFAQHNLPIHASQYGADPELRELASGLHRERAPLAPFTPEEAVNELRSASESGPVLKLPVVEIEDTAPRAQVIQVAVPAPRPLMTGGWWAFAALFVVMGGALVGSVHYAQGLRLELSQARLQQHTTDTALTALEQRAEGLREALDQSEWDRKNLSERFDAFIVGETQRRNAEATALERILGPRFESLREKALQEAYVSHP